MTGVFPSVLKTPKGVPVLKKDSKLDYSNYRSISLLSNIEKILKGTVMQIEKALINDRLNVSKVS